MVHSVTEVTFLLQIVLIGFLFCYFAAFINLAKVLMALGSVVDRSTHTSVDDFVLLLYIRLLDANPIPDLHTGRPDLSL